MTTTTTTLYTITARYAGLCAVCHTRIRVGQQIRWSRPTKLTFCALCVEGYREIAPRTAEVETALASAPVQATAAESSRAAGDYTSGDERSLGAGPDRH